MRVDGWRVEINGVDVSHLVADVTFDVEVLDETHVWTGWQLAHAARLMADLGVLGRDRKGE